MRIKFLIIILSLLFFHADVDAQESFTLHGTVTDANSGEYLIGASLYIVNSNSGTITNDYGYYSISTKKEDSLEISFSYLGYETQVKYISAQADLKLDIELLTGSQKLDEIVVTSKEMDSNVNSTRVGIIDIPTAKIKELPVIFGEPDVLKIIQLLPGVISGNEGTTGYFVRGGNPGQNLVLLDEAVVYNPNHLVGLVSAFNPRAINNVKLVKGGFSSEYGGRLSSILDIKMKEGNKKKLSGEGGIGLISSQLTLEGPIKKESSSFIISGRRTYFDILFKPFLPKKIKTSYTFYDVNAKLNFKLGENDRLYLSGFLAKDDAFYSQDGIEYNLLIDNKAATLRWNHIFNPKLFSNTSVIVNSFGQNITAIQDNAFSSVISGINDFSIKTQFEYFPNQAQKINMGFQFFQHQFKSSGDSKVLSGTPADLLRSPDSIPIKRNKEFALYVNDDIKFSEKFSMNVGLRLPAFLTENASYYRLEPRTTVRFGIDNSTSIKASYSLMNQFIHLIPSATAALPTDTWVPSTDRTQPQRSQQVSIGLFKNLKNNTIECSAELYYKTMEDQVLFKEGNQLIKSLDVDDLLVRGKGWSYGAEFFVKKKYGKFTGWASYTLAWAFQQFPDLNFGNKFPFRNDRRHDLSVVASFELNEKWTFASTFVFSSGSAYTVPVGRTSIVNSGSLFEGNYYLFEERNNARLADFHRLNLSAIRKGNGKIFGKKYKSEWVFSVYNAYSRKNPYFIYFDINPVTEQPRAIQVSLLPILPSISYNFKF